MTLRILSIMVNAFGSTYYRQFVPMRALREAGYEATATDIPSPPAGTLEAHNVIHLSRLAMNTAAPVNMIRHLQRIGKRVIIDYDDDLINIPEHNPAYGSASHPDVAAAVAAADAVTVTNDALAAVYRPYNRNIGIVPNYIDTKRWPAVKPRQGLTVGLVGSPSHIEDWRIIETPMRNIRRRYPDVRFLVVGFMPDYLADLATNYVAWQPVGDYQRMVNHIDIGLCPVLDDAFNKRKTPIKALEYGMAGAAVVASPTLYREVVSNRGTIARTADEWECAMAGYIEDASKRRQHAAALQRYVQTRCDARAHAHETYGTYRKLLGPFFARNMAATKQHIAAR